MKLKKKKKPNKIQPDSFWKWTKVTLECVYFVQFAEHVLELSCTRGPTAQLNRNDEL